jgi:hypothetical protein
MFTFRRATADDEKPVADMIVARSAWMRQTGVAGWEGWEAPAPALAGQATDPAFPVWVLTREGDGAVVGCTSVFDESPPWFWTEEERAKPAFFLASTVTDPACAGQRTGALIAWAMLDHAARTNREWVRRGTTEPGLVRYYRDVQGWDVVREKERDGFMVTGLARRAELRPALPVRIAR